MNILLEELNDLLFKLSIERAKEDPYIFSCLVFKDQDGNPIKPHIFHKMWFDHIDYCHSFRYTPYILAPFGSGKSSQIVVARILYELGRNPNLRIAIVSNDDNNAAKRVTTIREYLDSSIELKSVFPYLKRDSNRAWNDHALYLERPGKSIDPSVEAFGVMGKGTGTRLDLLIEDDVCDEEGAYSMIVRNSVNQNMISKWIPRLRTDGLGRRIGIATAWHTEDYVHNQIGSKRVCTLKQAVDEDLNGIICTVINPPDKNHPIFKLGKGNSINIELPPNMSKDYLLEVLDNIKERNFNRGFRQDALTTSPNRIYYNFDPLHNIRNLSLDSEFPIILSPDFNISSYAEYMAWVIIQDIYGEIRVIREIPLKQTSTRDAVRLFKSKVSAYQPIHVYGDATGWQSQHADGYSNFKVLKDELIPWCKAEIKFFIHPFYEKGVLKQPKNPSRIERHNVVNDFLKTPSGYRKLFIDPSCEATLKSVLLLEYKEGTTKIGDNEAQYGHTWCGIGYYLANKYRLQTVKPKQAEEEYTEQDFYRLVTAQIRRSNPVSEYLGTEI